jgi:hypothetical protein
MQPITDLTKKEEKFECGDKQQQAFDGTKAAVANEILCTYPNPNKRFILYPDAAQKYAMGGVLTQDYTGTELCCGTFSRKFTDEQLKYPVGEQEFLAVTENCDHFRPIIQGCKLLIRCDHKNTNAMTQHKNLRVLRKIVKLDQEYQAEFEHLARELNLGGDQLSRLPMLDNVPRIAINECYDDMPSQLVDEVNPIDKTDRISNAEFPLAMNLIMSEQNKNERIQAIITPPELQEKSSKITFGTVEVHALKGKILVPASLQLRLIKWYHENLKHPGVTQTINSIAAVFGWRGMYSQVEEFVKTCDECQRHKIISKPKYGHLRLVPALCNKEPWEKVMVDTAGPWTVRIDTCLKVVETMIHVMSMVDSCTNWPELALVLTKNSVDCAKVRPKLVMSIPQAC